MAALVEEDGLTPSQTASAAMYHLGSGGQRIRARLALHASLALGLASQDAVAIASTAELLHNASLVHDDLHDKSGTRRGVESVWSAFGRDVAIGAGDLLLSAAWGALASFQDSRFLSELIALTHARTAQVIRGQCSELSARGREITDMAMYEEIAVGKSGALLSLPLELAFAGSGKEQWRSSARRAAEFFAIGYQIADDIEDLARDSASTDGATGVNAVLVLRAAGYGGGASATARAIALAHLRTSMQLAEGLPSGAGTFLQDLAAALSARLRAV